MKYKAQMVSAIIIFYYYYYYHLIEDEIGAQKSWVNKAQSHRGPKEGIWTQVCGPSLLLFWQNADPGVN